MIMKSALMRKTLDNVIIVLICLKNFLKKKLWKGLIFVNKDNLYQYYYILTEPNFNVKNSKIKS